MNKNDLVEDVAATLGSTPLAKEAVEAVFDAIVRAVVDGETVRVTGFGSLSRVERPARTLRNPRTGERFRKEAEHAIRFRPGASFKALVGGRTQLPAEGSAIKKAPKTPRS
ncbi:HU family DNA-binding protein [Streptomyces cinereoruber]|uniref:HU family DNA-binding protein n=1 Tax=Streptomyces cinereoruber TaxID=67260 RepID=UPI003C2BDAA2